MNNEKDIQTMVSEIHKALIGDEYRKEGIVHKVDNHEKRLDKHDYFIWIIMGAVGLILFWLEFGDKVKEIL